MTNAAIAAEEDRHERAYREREAREREFEQKTIEYLERLTKVATLTDLLQVMRDAAGWALDAARAEQARKTPH